MKTHLRFAIVSCALIVAAGVPATAHAATFAAAGASINYTADPGDSETMTVAQGVGTTTLTVTGAGVLTDGDGGGGVVRPLV